MAAVTLPDGRQVYQVSGEICVVGPGNKYEFCHFGQTTPEIEDAARRSILPEDSEDAADIPLSKPPLDQSVLIFGSARGHFSEPQARLDFHRQRIAQFGLIQRALTTDENAALSRAQDRVRWLEAHLENVP